MAIITAANFDYKGPLANFERDSYATLSDMVNVNDNYLPNVFIGVCLETGKAYLYNKSNTVDPTLGKWRELVGGTDITDYIRKTEDFSTFEPMYYGEIAQYIGQTNQNYTHGYFYKAIPHFAYSNIQFTPSGDYEIEVSISDEDLTTFFNEEFIPTDSPFVSGQFGYRQTNPEVLWSFSPETETHEFRSHLGTPEQYAESGFTVTPPIGPSQGLTFTVDHSITYTYEQVDVQPATDLIWGNITGTLSDQTDLQNALDAKQDTLTAGTNITIEEDTQTGDLVISSVAQESFYRGRFSNWNSVPVNESGYLPEPGTQDLKTPTNNDFIVIIDPSDYASPEFTENFTFSGFNDPELGYGVSWTYLNVTYKVYGDNVIFGPGDCLRLEVRTGGLYARRTTIIDGTVLYPSSGVRWIGGSSHTASATGSPGDYTGTWRFYYNGDWATDGKLGWFPQYQIENTLPIATDTEPGITKLYTDLGENTDGAVDQATVTTELGKKQDTLTEGTGISIDENNVISATFSESYFRGKFSTWNTVPTDYRNYYPDYTGSTKPTRTDYMVVEDPSSYVKPGDPITIYDEPFVGGTAYARFVFGATDITLSHIQVSQAGETGITIGTVGNQLKITYSSEVWKLTPLDVPVIVDGVEKPVGQIAYSWHYYNGTSEVTRKELNFKGQGGYVGTWRFSYQSDNWDATGKNGWYPEYQIEDILPIADDTTSGIMKLYTTTGSNTDGTMDQSSITIELETLDTNKQDVLTNASNAGEGIIIDDVTQEISTNNIVWRKW